MSLVKSFVFLATIVKIITLREAFPSSVQSISLRLRPGDDIISQITSSLTQYKYSALSVASAVGSVRSCWLRFANNSYLTFLDGPFQITSLTGTFDKDLDPHIHIQLADKMGRSIGGHLPSLGQRKQNRSTMSSKNGMIDKQFGCPIFTTLQIAFLYHQDVIYQRKIDPETTYHELYIYNKQKEIQYRA